MRNYARHQVQDITNHSVPSYEFELKKIFQNNLRHIFVKNFRSIIKVLMNIYFKVIRKKEEVQILHRHNFGDILTLPSLSVGRLFSKDYLLLWMFGKALPPCQCQCQFMKTFNF